MGSSTTSSLSGFHFIRRIVAIRRVSAGRNLLLLLLTVLGLSSVGCTIAPPVSIRKLSIHRDQSDLTGLKTSQIFEELHVTWALPHEWESLPIKKNPLYTHQQWRSPTLLTGVGVAHITLPIPLPAQGLVWFAKNEYLKRARDQKDGKLIGQWTDSLGREWFEAENSKYHVRGYAMTQGNDAWIVYSGWRVTNDPQPAEIALARRSLESIVPAN